MKITRTVAMIGVVLLVPPALAQQMAVQPQQGQSTQQMNSDISACAASAQQASGYNPAQASAPSQPQVGGRAKGAAAGAAAGGVKQRQERRETRRETGAQQEAGNAYNQSYRSCLQGRGYAVN